MNHQQIHVRTLQFLVGITITNVLAHLTLIVMNMQKLRTNNQQIHIRTLQFLVGITMTNVLAHLTLIVMNTCRN